MVVINDVTNMPVIRPVACLDKLEIIEISKKIGTYETSILPFEDCCTIFLPKHPVINPELEKAILYENSFDYESLINECIQNIDVITDLKQEKNKVYTEFVPKPRFLYQGQFQGTARAGVYSNNVIGGYIDIPLGSRLGVGTITKAKSVQSLIDAEMHSLEQLLRNIRENIIANYYNAQILKDRIEIAKKQVEYASDSVTLAELRLDAGEGILIDVIQAQTIKNNARIELLSTIVDYNINQIQLLYDNGTISYENIVQNYKP